MSLFLLFFFIEVFPKYLKHQYIFSSSIIYQQSLELKGCNNTMLSSCLLLSNICCVLSAAMLEVRRQNISKIYFSKIFHMYMQKKKVYENSDNGPILFGEENTIVDFAKLSKDPISSIIFISFKKGDRHLKFSGQSQWRPLLSSLTSYNDQRELFQPSCRTHQVLAVWRPHRPMHETGLFGQSSLEANQFLKWPLLKMLLNISPQSHDFRPKLLQKGFLDNLQPDIKVPIKMVAAPYLCPCWPKHLNQNFTSGGGKPPSIIAYWNKPKTLGYRCVFEKCNKYTFLLKNLVIFSHFISFLNLHSLNNCWFYRFWIDNW